jgi:hypothetical protein
LLDEAGEKPVYTSSRQQQKKYVYSILVHLKTNILECAQVLGLIEFKYLLNLNVHFGIFKNTFSAHIGVLRSLEVNTKGINLSHKTSMQLMKISG